MKKSLEALSKFKNILAIETSGLYCSVALKSNGLITQKATKEANKHGLVILDFIEEDEVDEYFADELPEEDFDTMFRKIDMDGSGNIT